MEPIDRREFLKSSLLGVTAVSLSGHQSLAAQTPARRAANSSKRFASSKTGAGGVT